MKKKDVKEEDYARKRLENSPLKLNKVDTETIIDINNASPESKSDTRSSKE